MRLGGIITYIKSLINKSELNKRLYKGISWSLVGAIGSKFLQLLAFIIVARILGKEDYGRVGIIRSTINMFMIASTLGMSATATRYISFHRNQNPSIAMQIYRFTNKITLIFGLTLAVILFVGSGFIAEFSLKDTSLASALQIGAIATLFLSLTATQIGTLNGFEDFKTIGIQTTLNGLFQFVLIIASTYLWGINGAIIGLGVALVLYWLQLRHGIKPNVQKLKQNIVSEDSVKLSSIFLKFSLPSLLSSLAIIPVVWWTKTWLISHAGYDEMAIFDVSEQWYFILLFIPNSMSNIILTLLTNTSAEGSKQQYSYLIKINLLINVGITLIIGLIIGLFSPLINQLYGKDFTNYYPMLVMLFTAVICAANNVFGQVIASKGKMWIGFWLNTLWAVWLIVFTILFVGKMNLGALGLAYAMLISYILHSVAQGVTAMYWKRRI